MKTIILCFGAVILFTGAANAATKIDGKTYIQCIEMKLDSRLSIAAQGKCLRKIRNYISTLQSENLAKFAALGTPSAAKKPPKTKNIEPNYRNWEVRYENSALTDSKDVFLTATSSKHIYTRYGKAAYVLLNIRCLENTTSLIFNFGGEYMTDNLGYGVVNYRIDKQKAKKINLTASTNSEALALWSGGVSIPFIKKLFGKKNLLVRYTPYGESSKEVYFNIEGLEQVVKPLRTACNW